MQFKLPQELAALLAKFLSRGRKVLCGDTYPYVFSDKKCRHMAEPAVMTDYWRYLLVRMKAPTYFPPHR